MKIFDFFRSKAAKDNNIPIYSKRSSFMSLFGGAKMNVKNYYTSWVYICVTTIAQRVAGINLKLFKRDSKGNVEQVFNHPSLQLIEKANDFMTQYDVFERLQSNLELRGNEYWFLGAGKVPSIILPLQPDLVTPVPDQYNYIKEYVYKLDGEKFVIPPQNMLHFKPFNPDNDILGYSTLEAAKLAVDTDNFARMYNKKYFENDARPDVILSYPESLKPEDEKRILEAWNQNHGGPNRQFRTAVASGGLEISSFQLTQKDMEFFNGRTFNRNEIMATFRVPLSVVGITGIANRSEAEAVNAQFMESTIVPKMTRIINTLNEFYLKLFPGTENMYFEFENPVKSDRDLTLKEYESGIKNGYLSINDVRRREDMPEIQGGESVYVPFNVQPLGEPVEGKIVHAEVQKKNPISEKLSKKFSNSLKEFIEKEGDEEHVKEKTEEEKQFEAKGEWMVKQRDTRGLQYEEQFKKALDQLWDKQKQEAINNLRINIDTKQWRKKAINLVDKEKQVNATIDLFAPLFLALTTEEGEAALAFIGTGEFTITPNIRKFLESNTKRFAGEITEETSVKLRSTIAAGLEAGEAIQDLEKRIINSTAFNLNRAEKIARTETIRAQTKATQEVWKESGVVEAKIWYTALDERTCPLCEPMHEKVVSLNENFFGKGDIHEGNDGSTIDLDYEAVEGPPLHVQCRCTLIPVINE